MSENNIWKTKYFLHKNIIAYIGLVFFLLIVKLK